MGSKNILICPKNKIELEAYINDYFSDYKFLSKNIDEISSMFFETEENILILSNSLEDIISLTCFVHILNSVFKTDCETHLFCKKNVKQILLDKIKDFLSLYVKYINYSFDKNEIIFMNNSRIRFVLNFNSCMLHAQKVFIYETNKYSKKDIELILCVPINFTHIKEQIIFIAEFQDKNTQKNN